ncbi:uncharacterized protein required for cytochrome oxidase assembly [Burkholderiales bacterium JOSHI_001]|nr:uncharacterized protein required for cytochrome oxidase assembly [Burkholderiales bacterium JOSHI_001]
MDTNLVDFSPVLRLLVLAALLAFGPLAFWAWRQRHAAPRERLRALLALTAMLTFDLVVFGAFTRLTDSGLGCPDWPGCYGHASPFGAQGHIADAQAALPSGPVTHTKAWIEMVHRYLAMTVGALCVALLGLSWRWRRLAPQAPAWAAATLVWVLVQGGFGKFTVTLKLAPAVVTLHLLGGLLLLMLLLVQWSRLRPGASPSAGVSRGVVLSALALLLGQVALGGWVSSNYAVLACQGFPQCNGAWWPEGMDWQHGFTLWRGLGRDAQGQWLPATALVAIHMAHRLMAVLVLAVLAALAWKLSLGPLPRLGQALAALLALQFFSGLTNVVLGWPLLAALLHTAGAAALVGLLAHVAVLAGRPQTQTSRGTAATWNPRLS